MNKSKLEFTIRFDVQNSTQNQHIQHVAIVNLERDCIERLLQEYDRSSAHGIYILVLYVVDPFVWYTDQLNNILSERDRRSWLVLRKAKILGVEFILPVSFPFPSQQHWLESSNYFHVVAPEQQYWLMLFLYRKDALFEKNWLWNLHIFGYKLVPKAGYWIEAMAHSTGGKSLTTSLLITLLAQSGCDDNLFAQFLWNHYGLYAKNGKDVVRSLDSIHSSQSRSSCWTIFVPGDQLQ